MRQSCVRSYAIDYKNTLNMPKTGFPRHPSKRSQDDYSSLCNRIGYEYYQWQRHRNVSKEDYIISDGPPFANGNLHIGHALNKILKDIVLRSKVIQGHRVVMRPGWDCHGLPIEVKAVTELSSLQSDALKIRQRCRAFAEEAVNNQREMMRKWGLMADYDHPYRTMDKEYEAEQLRCFAKMVDLELVHRALRPVFWSPSSQTALAEAELEYQEMSGTAAFVAFHLIGHKDKLLIWTTTPWTLPANQAVAINSSLQYCRVENGKGESFIVAKAALHNLAPLNLQLICDVNVADILSHKYVSPITGNHCGIINADFVRPETGTGLVHLAPSYGHDDFDVFTKQNGNLEPLSIVDDSGNLTNCPDLDGMHIFDQKTTDSIFGKLGHNLVLSHNITHRYPVDWRTKKPVIIRATNQWFIDISKISSLIHTVIDQQVTFCPPSGKERLHKMIDSRTSWCISRQRHWGVPIPAFHDKQNQNDVILDAKIIRNITDIVQKEGTDCWWKLPVKDFLKNSTFDAQCYVKGSDTMDVWFDSGTAWSQSPQGQANLVVEGSDQFRGWFQSSLITSIACQQKPAYTNIVTHGFVLDEQMRKMSKSLGNVVDPTDVIEKYGVDVLRLWVASSQFTEDLSFSEAAIKSCRESYLKLRNTFKFMIDNISDIDSTLKDDEICELDKLAMQYSKCKLSSVLTDYNNFDFWKAHQTIMSFVTADMSGFYLDSVKDRLYLNNKTSLERRSAQSALKSILTDLAIVLTPMCPLLVDEVSDQVNIRFSTQQLPVYRDGECGSSFERLKALRKQVHTMSSIPMSHAIVKIPQSFSDFTIDTLRDTIGSASVEFSAEIDTPVAILSSMQKCPRCWYFKSPREEEPCFQCSQQLSLSINPCTKHTL